MPQLSPTTGFLIFLVAVTVLIFLILSMEKSFFRFISLGLNVEKKSYSKAFTMFKKIHKSF